MKVTQEDRFFAIDDETPDQVPKKGTCIRLSSPTTYYTLKAPKSVNRGLTVRLRPCEFDIIAIQRRQDSRPEEMIRQVFDLSLSNWRAFNAAGFPVSILYSHLISQILQKADFSDVSGAALTERMWFL